MTAVESACATCGASPARLDARFCDACGSPLADCERLAEFKHVTVLFADVVRSMDIAAQVGPERLREIMAGLVDRAATTVRRYGGTMDKFTGDGVMAVFGAPMALEDHALRACRAALDIQAAIRHLAVEIAERNGVELQLRVGLNSGEVIAGEIGGTAMGYTAVGEQVGMAQRMESAAPPGGVMISGSTARLVDGRAELGEVELVHIKGADRPVPARRLLGVADSDGPADGPESTLVGRNWEMAAAEGLLDRALEGHGAVLAVAGEPGIGKSRLTRDVSALAAARGVEAFTTYCEPHTTDVAFHAVSRLLRAAVGVNGQDGVAARAQVRSRAHDADPEDMLLFDDLLGIADPDVELPRIDPDARRRRLTALVNAALLARNDPAVYVIEDAHWIDEVSEAMVAGFVAVIPQTPSLVLITYRPEYRGTLSRVPGAQVITLAPLNDSQTASLVSQLIGADPSVTEVASLIAERAAGNPFFAQEVLRDLAERGVLVGGRGAYVCTADVSELSVPATLQATIAARIDRLGSPAKRTLNAAAVVGMRFGTKLLETLGTEPTLEHLVGGEFIDQVTFTRDPEYVFRHPLIRAVAYESQLKSDRARLHRRVAAAVEERGAGDQDAALIAEHLEAAGDLHDAYRWHMRAATWATDRDTAAARLSWERAQIIADALPPDDPNRSAMRIEARTVLCGLAWRVHVDVSSDRFEELRQLCAEAGDKASLAIAMSGLVMDHAYHARIREAAELASESWAFTESLGDPALLMGLSVPPIYAKWESAGWPDMLRWSQRVIDLAAGDPSKGTLLAGGAPLPLALTTRAIARYFLGRTGWGDDIRIGLAIARDADPFTYAGAVTYGYAAGIGAGVQRSCDSAVREIENAQHVAERSGNDFAVAHVGVTLGVALVHRPAAVERARGERLLTEVQEVFLNQGHHLGDLPIVTVYLAREGARRGESDEALSLMRCALDDLIRRGQLLGTGITATGVLVETLLQRAAPGDLVEADAAIERLAAAATDYRAAVREVWLLRMRALLAQARGESQNYIRYRDHYRELANEFGFEGHVDWAAALP